MREYLDWFRARTAALVERQKMKKEQQLERRKAYRKNYYLAHREKFKAYMKEYNSRPEVKARRSASQKIVQNSSATLAKRSISMKKMYSKKRLIKLIRSFNRKVWASLLLNVIEGK